MQISYGYVVTWVYENDTGVDLDLEAYNEFGDKFGQWEIQNQSKVIFPRVDQDFAVFPFHFQSNRVTSADSVVARFENEKCLVYTTPTSTEYRDIFDEKNYNEYEKVAIKNPNPGGPYFKGPIVLTWTFTPDDLAQAMDCDSF